jgi:enoyl-CoA hydratase
VEHLDVERRDAVAIVTLVDVERRNAMTAAMVAEIVETFDVLERDGTGAVVVTGAPPAFCSGADVAALGRLGDADDDERAGISSVYEGFLRVLRSTLPTVAAVNGPAVGAGMNLALACDVRVAGESARFDPRFLRIGLHPGGGHLWMLERLAGPQTAAAMVLFGEAVSGREAVGRGLAWACVADDELLDTAVALAARAAALPRELASRAKATLREAPWHADFDAAVAREVEHQTWSFAQPAFRERRGPRG